MPNSLEYEGIDRITIYLIDTVQYRLLLEGIRRHFSWDCDRRLRTWAQYDTPSRGLINLVLEDQSGRHPTK